MRISNKTWVALIAGAAALAGCSSGSGRNEVASRPAPAPQPPVAQPAPRPVVGISPQEALWNMRSALNVAALSCRGSRMPGVAPAYNRMLSRHKAPLADAYAAVQAKYKARHGAAWARHYDRDATGLYNRYAMPTAQLQFCRAATSVLASANGMTPASITGFAPMALAQLEAPFGARRMATHRL
jgi:hypothetical protein